MRVSVPRGFSFIRTIYSHGWFDLPPFRWDEGRRVLRRAIRTGRGSLLDLSMKESEEEGLEVRITAPGRRASAEERREAEGVVRHMFRLDDAMDGFYSLCREHPQYRWVPETGAGRLLRAPGPFEDLIKLICTTNCSWSLTRIMIERLVTVLGDEVPGRPGARVFPGPEVMASRPLRFYRDRIKAGYRAPHLREAARRVASGDLEPASWLEEGRPSADLAAEILSLPGAGPYVAENMMKLLGRYGGLGLDSWCRRKFSQLHGGGRRRSDRAIRRHYSRFGPWRGLALWCDLTREWCEGPRSGADILRVQKY